MENLDPKPVIEPVAEQSDLQRQMQSIRQTVVSLLVLVILISATFNVYMWRQVKYSRGDLFNYRQQTAPILAEYQEKFQPTMKTVLNSLYQFGKSPQADAGFASLMTKYGLTNAPSTNGAPVAPLPKAK